MPVTPMLEVLIMSLTEEEVEEADKSIWPKQD